MHLCKQPSLYVILDFERSIFEIRPQEGSCNTIAKFLPNSAQRRSVCVSLNAALAASDTLSPFENPRRHWHLGTFTRVSQQFQGAHGSSRNSGSPGNLLNMALVIYQDMSGPASVTPSSSFP